MLLKTNYENAQRKHNWINLYKPRFDFSFSMKFHVSPKPEMIPGLIHNFGSRVSPKTTLHTKLGKRFISLKSSSPKVEG